MKREVHFHPNAEADLFGLYNYIATHAGLTIAGEYIERLEAACLTLATYSERGTKRDDLQPGIRTIGFERRATIAFRVLKERVEIMAIAYGGRDFEAELRDKR